MSVGRDFIEMALDLAGRALGDVVARDNLQLQPRTMPRTRRQRAGGRLKQIEEIVRRLIFLMALALKLAPVVSRGPAKTPELAPGVELAMFPRVMMRRLVLMPRPQCPVGSGSLQDSIRAVSSPSGPVSTAPLILRIIALQRILNAPEAAAKRLARTIERLKAKGEPKPLVGSATRAFRLGPELGAVSTALPGLLNNALETWERSG